MLTHHAKARCKSLIIYHLLNYDNLSACCAPLAEKSPTWNCSFCTRSMSVIYCRTHSEILWFRTDACSCAHEPIRVTPGPGPTLWSHSRGPERATRCTDLSSAHLCARGACWGVGSGVNVLNHSSPWRASGPVSQSEPGSFTSPPSLPKDPTEARRGLGIFYAPSRSCHSWFTFGGSDGVSVPSPSSESNFSHLPLACTLHLSLSCQSTPFSCLCAHSLTHTLILTHTHQLLPLPVRLLCFAKWVMPFEELRFIVTHRFSVVY